MTKMNTTTYPSNPMKDINPAWEAEIKKQLDAIWNNRYRLSQNNLQMLKNLANKTRL